MRGCFTEKMPLELSFERKYLHGTLVTEAFWSEEEPWLKQGEEITVRAGKTCSVIYNMFVIGRELQGEKSKKVWTTDR